MGEDADSALNGKITFSVLNVTLLPSSFNGYPKTVNLPTDLFEIESETGVVRNKIMLNRDVADGYTLKVGKSCLRRIGKIFILKVFSIFKDILILTVIDIQSNILMVVSMIFFK